MGAGIFSLRSSIVPPSPLLSDLAPSESPRRVSAVPCCGAVLRVWGLPRTSVAETPSRYISGEPERDRYEGDWLSSQLSLYPAASARSGLCGRPLFFGAGIFPAGRFFQLRLKSDFGKHRPSATTCPLDAPPHEGARSMAKGKPFNTSSAGRAQTPCSLTAKVSARELAEDRGEGRALQDGETPVQNRRPGRLCDPAGAESSPSIRLLD